MKGKLAVLIPAFEGGQLLRRTVASCLNAGLERPRYSVIVIDNASQDGSADGLGPDVIVSRNQRNLGRIDNWNRAVKIAESTDASYVTFLFVGDEWIRNGGIGPLLDSMDASDSVFGMAALRIVNEQDQLIREGTRVTIRGAAAHVDSQKLLDRTISSGRLPFAPLQANVYRVFRERPLRFSAQPEDALNCDLEATARFLQDHPGVVSIGAEPYLLWKERAGRFFTAQDPWSVFIQTRQTLKRLSASTGIAVNWESANAVAMLAALRETSHSLPRSARLAFQYRAFRYLLQSGSGLSAKRLAYFVAGKLFLGRNYLDLSAEAEPPLQGSAAFQTAVE